MMFQRFRHQTPFVQVYITQWTISYNSCCNQATLTCLGFSKLPLQLCAQLINRKQLVNPTTIQTLALTIKAGENCFCFVFSENLISLPALPKKALDRSSFRCDTRWSLRWLGVQKTHHFKPSPVKMRLQGTMDVLEWVQLKVRCV